MLEETRNSKEQLHLHLDLLFLIAQLLISVLYEHNYIHMINFKNQSCLGNY